MSPEPFKLVRLSQKGQLIIPVEIRERLGWEAGDYVIVETEGEKVVLSRLNPETLHRFKA